MSVGAYDDQIGIPLLRFVNDDRARVTIAYYRFRGEAAYS
jgi:hypothetical protein